MREGYRFELPIEVRYRDIDALGHVNNAVYFSYMEHARIRYMQNLGLMPARPDEATFILAEVTCQFKAPVPYGMPLVVRVRVTEHPDSYRVARHDRGVRARGVTEKRERSLPWQNTALTFPV